jgi:hypothetical protein
MYGGDDLALRRAVARAVREECLRAAREGCEEARMDGLCWEGAWEATLAAIAAVDVEAILGEDAGTANHANRVALAQGCLVEVKRERVVAMLLSVIVTNGTVQTQGDGIADGDLRWLVAHYLGMGSFVAGALAGVSG